MGKWIIYNYQYASETQNKIIYIFPYSKKIKHFLIPFKLKFGFIQ